MTEPEPQHNTGTDIEQPFVYLRLGLLYYDKVWTVSFEGTDIA